MPQVKKIDIPAIFVKAAGHPLPEPPRVERYRPNDNDPKKFIAGNLGTREQRKISY